LLVLVLILHRCTMLQLLLATSVPVRDAAAAAASLGLMTLQPRVAQVWQT
jgi:hypothetical protein